VVNVERFPNEDRRSTPGKQIWKVAAFIRQAAQYSKFMYGRQIYYEMCMSGPSATGPAPGKQAVQMKKTGAARKGRRRPGR
jgi:hypothetical protein